MTVKKRGLGRGLDALLGAGLGASVPSIEPETGKQQDLHTIPIDLIQRGEYQPRRDIDQNALQELASSIKEQGVIQPIVLRPIGNGRYELIAGERRWRASQLAGLQDIPAVVREMTDKVALSVAIIENIQREDLNPLEEAVALDRLLNEFELTHQLVADAVGRSRASVSNLLRLLDLDEELKGYLAGGKIEMGHARAMLPLGTVPQRQAAREVIAKQLSVRQTEALVRRLQRENTNPAETKSQYENPDVAQLVRKLSDQLGAKVSLTHNQQGKGLMTIQFNSLDELDGILEHIK